MTSTKEYDARRRKEKPWRRWYNTPRWRVMRDVQLGKTPWCEPCKAEGRSRPATTVNHLVRHNGDPALFWDGKLESVCENCHNQGIQRAELEGFRRSVDDDGWPLDPAHPFNRPSGGQPHKRKP